MFSTAADAEGSCSLPYKGTLICRGTNHARQNLSQSEDADLESKMMYMHPHEEIQQHKQKEAGELRHEASPGRTVMNASEFLHSLTSDNETAATCLR